MKAYRFLLLVSLIAIIGYACKDPLEGVVIKTKDALSTSAIKIRYYNANYGDPERLPKDFKISIIGTDASKIVNSVGGKKITFSKEGLLGIAVSPDYTDRPLKFSVVAEAEGYLTSIREFQLTDQRNIDLSVGLLKIANLPGGLSLNQNSGKASSNGAASALTIDTKGKKEGATWVISEGTILKDQYNQPVEGKLTAILTYYEGTGNAKNFVPNAWTVYNAVDLNGKTLKPFEFNNFCFFQTELFNEQFQKVTSFSQPSDVTVEINENALHTTGNKLKVGDKIIFWGFLDGVWKQMGEVVIRINGNGKFEVTVKISKAGYYTFGEMNPVCEKGPIVSVSSKFTGCDIYYYVKLIDAVKGTEIGAFWLNPNNGSKTSLAGRRQNTVYMQLFDYNWEYGGDLTKPIYQSAPFDLCEEKTINVNIPIQQPTPITMELVIKCPEGKTLNEADFPAEMYSQYRLTGSDPNSWRDLFKLTRTNRKLTTNKVQLGKRYVLRSTTNPAQGWPFLQKDTTITQAYYLIKINGEQYCK